MTLLGRIWTDRKIVFPRDSLDRLSSTRPFSSQKPGAAGREQSRIPPATGKDGALSVLRTD
jgi:hypothetical protein